MGQKKQYICLHVNSLENITYTSYHGYSITNDKRALDISINVEMSKWRVNTDFAGKFGWCCRFHAGLEKYLSMFFQGRGHSVRAARPRFVKRDKNTSHCSWLSCSDIFRYILCYLLHHLCLPGDNKATPWVFLCMNIKKQICLSIIVYLPVFAWIYACAWCRCTYTEQISGYQQQLVPNDHLWS
jgi:hypothetical protein